MNYDIPAVAVRAMNRDTLYQNQPFAPGSFRFDEPVVSVFSDMIRRSVPGYEDTLRLTGRLAARFAEEGCAIVDLGCSLGDSLLACAQALGRRPIPLLGIDNSAPMIAQAKARFAELALPLTPRFLCQDLRTAPLPRAALLVCNWTLQFLPPGDRTPVLERLFAALRPGGALLLSEKLCFEDPAEDALLSALHHEFKAAQGYSPSEIEGKRQALETVLVRETQAAHEARLRAVGFTHITLVQQNLNFASLLAVKPHAA